MEITVGGTVADGEENFSKTLTMMWQNYSFVRQVVYRYVFVFTHTQRYSWRYFRRNAILSGGAHPILLNDEKLVFTKVEMV